MYFHEKIRKLKKTQSGMIETTPIRVFLDYLIPRQSIRYINNNVATFNHAGSNNSKTNIIYRDLASDWFNNLRKPDFQRETNAWTSEQCVEFLDSVINGRIIPSVILWYSEDNGCTYVLDGAHRLSVIRAWMLDDWGDKSETYYKRKDDKELIKRAAEKTRNLVNSKIGSYKSFVNSHKDMVHLSDIGEAPKLKMTSNNFEQAKFYGQILNNSTLPTQWEHGNYERAEQSFLRINRQGQALDPWEATLIEYRRGSYARVVMSIANGGQVGHFLPSDDSVKHLKDLIDDFPKICGEIYTKLFVPQFKHPISDLNVPMMISPAYFQKHKYLLELIPLITSKEIALEDEKQINLLGKDVKGTPEEIIKNANKIITEVSDILESIISYNHNPKCLAIVPLFYWYNERGQYNRSLLYGFLYWLFSGSEEDIKIRKHIFCAYRDRFEFILHDFKSDISKYLNLSGGAGLKSVKQAAVFFQNLLNELLANPKLAIGSQELNDLALNALNTASKSKNKVSKNSRDVSMRDKTQVNIRELFKSSTKCHICGGTLNLSLGGVQYDHVIDFQYIKETTIENLDLTHPYCNRNKHRILDIRSEREKIKLPNLIFKKEGKKDVKANTVQLNLFWGVDDFPH